MKKVEMIEGSLPKNIILFSVPVILTGFLSLLFHACDMVVVGQFSGSKALAAVGSSGSLINFFVGAAMSLSLGVNVLAAQSLGAKNLKKIKHLVHVAIPAGFLIGLIQMILGLCTGRWFLEWLDTPQDIIDLACTYLYIYMCGIPAVTLYSFSAAVFRAQGNTKSPLIYLTFAGILNVILNLIFVIGFHWSVAGIASATVISQYFSAFLALRHLKTMDEVYALKFRLLNLDKKILKDIFYIGVPASVNSVVFSFSNMQIQSAINFFGSSAVAGCAAAGNLEGFVYISMNSMYQAALSFTGQNMGASRYDRISQILKISILYVVILGLITGIPLTVFGETLLGLYTNDPEAIEIGMIRNKWIMLPYFLCGIMEVYTGVIRGLGYSITPTLITLACACGLRVLWVTTVFRMYPNPPLLFSVYTISWVLTTIGLIITYRHGMKQKTSVMLTA